MNELSSLLSKLIDSPEGMEKIKDLASGLLSNNGEAKKEPTENKTGLEDMLSGLSGGDISKMMSVMSALNSKEDDNRSRLLISLKPHLSEERRERVDTAVQILRLIKIMPLLNMK